MKPKYVITTAYHSSLNLFYFCLTPTSSEQTRRPTLMGASLAAPGPARRPLADTAPPAPFASRLLQLIEPRGNRARPRSRPPEPPEKPGPLPPSGTGPSSAPREPPHGNRPPPTPGASLGTGPGPAPAHGPARCGADLGPGWFRSVRAGSGSGVVLVPPWWARARAQRRWRTRTPSSTAAPGSAP